MKQSKPTLSGKLYRASEKVISDWQLTHSEDDLLALAQQVNYAGTLLKTLGSQFEEEYKKNIRIKNS